MHYSIMIIDDHPIIHDGLKTLLANETNLVFVEGATSSSDALEKFENNLPDLAIVDLSLGDSDGTYLIQRIKSKYPKLRILVYSMSEERLFAPRAAGAGADGYVMKTSEANVLAKAIHTVLSGKTFFPESYITDVTPESLPDPMSYHSVLDILSNREIDIFNLIAQGMNSSRIGEKLNISRNTVDTHRINIKNKLDLPSGKALDRFAFKIIKQGQMPPRVVRGTFQKRQTGR